MTESQSSIVERIARVLAGQRLSSNAEGSNPSAGEAVDAAWREHLDDAVAVLKTMREPDAAMTRAGDATTWEAMIRAALGEILAQEGVRRGAEQVFGPDEEGETPLDRDAITTDRKAWVHADR